MFLQKTSGVMLTPPHKWGNIIVYFQSMLSTQAPIISNSVYRNYIFKDGNPLKRRDVTIETRIRSCKRPLLVIVEKTGQRVGWL